MANTFLAEELNMNKSSITKNIITVFALSLCSISLFASERLFCKNFSLSKYTQSIGLQITNAYSAKTKLKHEKKEFVRDYVKVFGKKPPLWGIDYSLVGEARNYKTYEYIRNSEIGRKNRPFRSETHRYFPKEIHNKKMDLLTRAGFSREASHQIIKKVFLRNGSVLSPKELSRYSNMDTTSRETFEANVAVLKKRFIDSFGRMPRGRIDYRFVLEAESFSVFDYKVSSENPKTERYYPEKIQEQKLALLKEAGFSENMALKIISKVFLLNGQKIETGNNTLYVSRGELHAYKRIVSTKEFSLLDNKEPSESRLHRTTKEIFESLYTE